MEELKMLQEMFGDSQIGYEINRKRNFIAQGQDYIVELKSRIREELEKINRYTFELKELEDKLETMTRDLHIKIKEQLDNARTNPMIEKILVEENYIEVYTKQLTATDGEYRFLVNAYRIEIKPKDMDIRVYGIHEDLCRESSFSSHDPHPHVSGVTGKPCWGNTELLLVEMFEQKQIDVVIQLVIDYLQTFNLEDVAGRHIKNWQCVDEEGNELECPFEEYSCHICDAQLDEDDYYTCDECGEIICSDCYYWINDEIICDNCVDRNYTYSNLEDRYINNDDVITCNYCGECFSDYYEDKIVAYDGSEFCSVECAQNAEYYLCEECKEWHCIDNMTYDGEVDECWYCDDCFESIKEMREENKEEY